MDMPFARCRQALLPLGLFLLVFGAKLAVIDRYGSDMPFWDQWSKEGELLYVPWFDHGQLWHSLFLPHSEHRMAPTLALNLALVAAGGQWDARAVRGQRHAGRGDRRGALGLGEAEARPVLGTGRLRPRPPLLRPSPRLGERARRLPVAVLLPGRLLARRDERPAHVRRPFRRLAPRAGRRAGGERQHGLGVPLLRSRGGRGASARAARARAPRVGHVRAVGGGRRSRLGLSRARALA